MFYDQALCMIFHNVDNDVLMYIHTARETERAIKDQATNPPDP